MKIRIRLRRKVVGTAAACLSGMALSAVLCHILNTEDASLVLNMAWVFVITAYVAVRTYSFHMTGSLKLCVFMAFILRLLLIVWNAYGSGGFADFLGRGDQQKFWRIAGDYYRGNFNAYSTNYPYVVNVIFHIFGSAKLMPMILNTLCWFLGYEMLQMAGGDFYGKVKTRMAFLYAFLPYALLNSAQLLRESIMGLCLMISVYFLWKWMGGHDMKNILWSLAVSVPAIILHTGNIAMWGAIFFTYVFWDPGSRKWRKMTRKNCILIVVIAVAIPLYENVIMKVFSGYLPSVVTLESITSSGRIEHEIGRTDYVPTLVSVTNMRQFFFQTAYRMVYFWISPTPRFWSSPLDVFGFAVDSLPWMVVFAYFARKRKILNPQSKVVWIIILAFTMIYGWGTRNAGAAMRHRDLLLGVVAMAFFIGQRKKGSASQCC